MLRGEQGVGKTIVGRSFGHLLGFHYKMVSNSRYVTGRFNSHLANLLLFHADEAVWAGDHDAEGILKDLITGDRHLIEYKGIEPLEVANFVRFFATGNREWLVPAGLDERRFAVLDVGEAQKQDIPYFAAIEAELEAGGYGRLLFELLEFDLSSVDVRTIPKTKALLEQKIETLTLEQKWWVSMLRSGALPDGCSEDNRALCAAIWNQYAIFAGGLKSRRELSIETKIGMFLSKVTKGKAKRHRPTFGVIGGKPHRAWVYDFPPLADCRAMWDEITGHPGDWGDTEPEDWQKDTFGASTVGI